jgi:chitin synthase
MATPTPSSASQTDLVGLLRTSNTRATVVPSDDALVAVLSARYRSDLAYTSLASSTLVAVNPLRTLADVSDVSAKEYAERTNGGDGAGMSDSEQPHPYDFAGRIWTAVRGLGRSQVIVYR